MRRLAIVAITILTAAAVGCGEDGPDAPGAALAAADDGGAAEIQVVGGAADQAGAHDAAATGDAMHDEVAEPHDEATDGVMHDDTTGDAMHDEATGAHDEATDDAMHDDATGAHDEATDDAMHDDATGAHDEATGAHDEAAGDAGGAAVEPAGLVIEVDMLEFGYELDRSSVPMGEPVTFRFHNRGAIEHEAMFGSAHQQTEYAAAGDHGDGHGGDSHHGDVAAITLAAGASGDMVLTFDSPGEIWIGCHIAGHWDAGMYTTFDVG